MQQYHLACVVGARPNFMKIAPLLRAFEAYPNINTVLVHTGQHYDPNLSDIFFEELGIKRPDANLEVGSGGHAVQTARVLEGFAAVLEAGTAGGQRFDRVVVVGDVNSTLAASLAAVKLGVPVAHVEAGLRSRDRSMPEEINRIVTDSISDLLFVSEPDGVENLKAEGHSPESIHLTGNVMIDTLRWLLPKAQSRDTLSRYELQPGGYGVVTLHRPANVDEPQVLAGILDVLARVSDRLPLIFPIHPRTRARVEQFGLLDKLSQAKGMILCPPLGYIDFLALTSQAKVVVTDSGGLQEESTALGIPCLTMRPNTERPVTVTEGTSVLVGNDPLLLERYLDEVLSDTFKPGRCPESWDGHAAERIAKVLVASFE